MSKRQRRIQAASSAMESAEVRATRQVLEERRARVQKCSEELNALLKRHGCTVEVSSTVIQVVGQPGGRTVCTVNVVPLELTAAAPAVGASAAPGATPAG